MFALRRRSPRQFSAVSHCSSARLLLCRYSSAPSAAKKPFDVLFFGRDEFSQVVFQHVYNARDVWNTVELVTQPDMKVGRGGSVLSVSPLKQLGESMGVPVHLIPPDKASFKTWQPPAAWTSAPPPDNRLLVTASFGRILPNALLSLFALGRRLNVHPSLLPAYRGAAPIQHTLMDGRAETGVCIIEMLARKQGIDAGEIWGVRAVDVPADSDFLALRDRLAAEGGTLLVSVLRQMLAGKAQSVPQADGTSAPRAPAITADDALVDFANMTASALVRRCRGISHQKPLFTHLLTGKTVQLFGLSVHEPDSEQLRQSVPEAGMAAYHPPTRALVVRCAAGTLLRVEQLQTEAKKLAPAKEWWNGVRPDWRAGGGNKGPVSFVR